MDGRVLAQARAALESKRKQHEELYSRRLENAYAKAPSIRNLDAQIRATMLQLLSVAMNAEGGERIEEIRLRNTQLQQQRRKELQLAGLSENYLDDDYMCQDCRDTGYRSAEMCSCLADLYKEEQRKVLSSLFILGDESFEAFDLSYYDDTLAADTSISPRRSMEIIYETCVEYARKFGKNSMNLFFNGAPGLGKTFLSACIARVVAENSHSVVYDMATSVFAKFEDVKFSRTDDLEEARGEVQRYLECDLLILDDLGTEMTTKYTISALYEIINTRLVTGKKTIVSSNLTIDELRRIYSEQIMSRIEGEYHTLTFRGDDIRRIKNRL